MKTKTQYVCQQCQAAFSSRGKGKLFCSLKCYAKSDVGKQKLADACAKGAAARRLKKGMVEISCLHCHKQLWTVAHVEEHRRKKFCNPQCKRAYWNKLFDSLIANPELMPLPQNYDEFLDSDELRCILPGCEWVGSSLSGHLWFFHGVTAAKFKELAGFNRRTGLVGKSMSAKLAESKIGQENTTLKDYNANREHIEKVDCHPGIRLEGKEHFKKCRLGRKHSDATKKKIKESNIKTKNQKEDDSEATE